MKLGAVATGSDFFNREQDLLDIWEKLEADHLILSGPRRIGTSSVLHQLIAESKAHGYWQAELVDMQGIDSAQGFIDSLKNQYPSLKEQEESIIGKIPFEEAKVFGFALKLKEQRESPWQQQGDRLLSQLATKKHLILIDEFSVFLETLIHRNRDEAIDFLDWLRRWRLDQKSQCKFIFSGSIGLQFLLEMYGWTAKMNDCYPYELGPFKLKHATAMLQKFAAVKKWQLDDDNAKLLCAKIGWLSPFFLNLLLNESIHAARDRIEEQEIPSDDNVRIITSQDIKDGYERLLASRSRFLHWETRLKKQLPVDQFGFCRALLTYIAKSDDGLSLSQLSGRLAGLQPDAGLREQWMKKLLLQLIDEGYLSAPDGKGKVHFLSFLLKDYWKRNHG